MIGKMVHVDRPSEPSKEIQRVYDDGVVLSLRRDCDGGTPKADMQKLWAISNSAVSQFWLATATWLLVELQ